MYKFILFDLDDTLYPRSDGLMQQVGRRIQTWMCERMDLAWDEAAVLRRQYLVDYGTTMSGLLAEHQIDAHDYLVYVHDIPVDEYIDANPALVEMLGAIPLRRLVYTNGTSEYAERVLRALGVRDCFEDVIGIEDVGLCNKYHQAAYEQVLVRLDAWGPECIMVEDMVRNLHPAKALGMTTVLVDGVPDWSVDYAVKDVLHVGQIMGWILENRDAD